MVILEQKLSFGIGFPGNIKYAFEIGVSEKVTIIPDCMFWNKYTYFQNKYSKSFYFTIMEHLFQDKNCVLE